MCIFIRLEGLSEHLLGWIDTTWVCCIYISSSCQQWDLVFPLPNSIMLIMVVISPFHPSLSVRFHYLKKKWPLTQDYLLVLNMISLVSGLINNYNSKPHCSSVEHLPSPISDKRTIVWLCLRSVCHGNWISSYISEQTVLSDPQNLMLPLISGRARRACWLR